MGQEHGWAVCRNEVKAVTQCSIRERSACPRDMLISHIFPQSVLYSTQIQLLTAKTATALHFRKVNNIYPC